MGRQHSRFEHYFKIQVTIHVLTLSLSQCLVRIAKGGGSEGTWATESEAGGQVGRRAGGQAGRLGNALSISTTSPHETRRLLANGKRARMQGKKRSTWLNHSPKARNPVENKLWTAISALMQATPQLPSQDIYLTGSQAAVPCQSDSHQDRSPDTDPSLPSRALWISYIPMPNS